MLSQVLLAANILKIKLRITELTDDGAWKPGVRSATNISEQLSLISGGGNCFILCFRGFQNMDSKRTVEYPLSPHVKTLSVAVLKA